jgi:hypothetical protein
MRDEPAFDQCLLPLKRPEYVPLPEVLISSLAWQLNEDQRKADDKAAVGRVFRALSESKAKKISIVQRPEGREQRSSLGVSLKQKGIRPDSLEPLELAEGALSSVAGIKSSKGRTQAASPLTPHLALLQNARGVTAKKSPPDVAGYLQQLFDLGARGGSATGPLVATTWYNASTRRLHNDPLLRTIDHAVRDSLLQDIAQGLTFKEPDLPPANQSILSDCGPTPFTWFRSSWLTLTSDAWVDALPARVWVDWALAILRLSVGMGYLWESSWYVRLGEAIVRGHLEPGRAAPSPQDIAQSIDSLLPWRKQRSSVSIRDVNPALRLTTFRGQAVRELLGDYLEAEKEIGRQRFTIGLENASRDDDLVGRLREKLSTRQPHGRTAWETIRYNLLTREESGPFTDYYGLLRMNGPRYLVIEPGTEWIAVVASLACREPGGEANLGDLLASLAELGLYPEMTDIVALLERAGLARGSADADQGVQIKSAY